MTCLFCNSVGPFTDEHVVPASLGNDDLVLVNEVCAECNDHFGRKVEAPVLSKSPLAFWRTFLGIRTRRGRQPSVDLSQPAAQKGRLPSIHPAHDNGVGFSAHGDGTVSVDIDDPQIVQEIVNGTREQFRFVFTPNHLFDFGRFLCKVGIELLCSADPVRARHEFLDEARRFARYGNHGALWPIFHFSEGCIGDLKQVTSGENGAAEEVTCYTYALLEVPPEYLLFQLGVGTDRWVICLNDPFPTPDIRRAFPGRDLELIWYSPQQVG